MEVFLSPVLSRNRVQETAEEPRARAWSGRSGFSFGAIFNMSRSPSSALLRFPY